MKIFNDDAYEKIKEFQEQGVQVDHIITDPPYNISKIITFQLGKVQIDKE